MASAVIAHNPQLTAEQLVAILEKGFLGRYEVYATKLIGADAIVKKSGWTGVRFRLSQKQGQTKLIYGPMSPSAGARMLMLGLIPFVILWFTSWKQITAEVKAFIESSPELNGDAAVAAPIHAAADAGPQTATDPPDPMRHTIAAGWMAATALAIPMISALFSGYFFDFYWIGFGTILGMAATAAIAFGGSMLLEGPIENPLLRGAAIGAGSYFLAWLVLPPFYFDFGSAFGYWLGFYGLLHLALAAGSGVGMSLFLGSRSRG